MKHTIIMSGGLGNQMFQYAFYLSLKKRGIKCKIDDTLFYTAKMHNGFELNNIFPIREELSVPSAIKKVWYRLLRKYRPKILLFKDKVYQYCPEVYKSKCIYYMGDWLSYKYFDDIRELIIDTYQFKDISSKNQQTAQEMQKVESVSIHIRRGDYLVLPYYCVCDEHYYRRAIQNILKHVANPIFYVFSNESSWCVDFMKQFNVRFEIVDWNQGKDSYQDMFLMTQCKHNIIANSTFSWWGAWLNSNPAQLVIAPSKWFKNSNHNINCPNWQLIKTK